MEVKRKLLPLSLLFVLSPVAAREIFSADQLIDLPLEDLMKMDTTVSSASRRDESLKDTPSAIFVIDSEDLRRAAITNIPDALRMVPGIQVGRISANEWAISSRGLGGRYSRYLLVLVDGRSVYTSLFSGVNWDELNIALEDIDRIEVIRGPAGTAWGSNAVNGVINIITRKPDVEDKLRVRATAGNLEEPGSLLLSGTVKTSANSLLNVTAQENRHGALGSNNTDIADSDWGDRRLDADWLLQSGPSSVEISAGVSSYQSDNPWKKQRVEAPYSESFNGNEDKDAFFVSTALGHKTDNGEWKLLLKYDAIHRDSSAFKWDNSSWDAQLQWSGAIGASHQVTFGASTRHSSSDFQYVEGGLQVWLTPPEQKLRNHSGFVQDSIALTDAWQLALGLRFDSHSLSNNSLQPSVRSLYRFNDVHRAWVGVSQATSSPSRVINSESELAVLTVPASLELPLPTRYVLQSRGDSTNDVEVTAFEIGYRFEPHARLNADLVAYQQDYKNIIGGILDPNPELRSENGQPFFVVPFVYDASGKRSNTGVELSVKLQAHENWFLQYSGTYSNPDFGAQTNALSLNFAYSDTAPKFQHSLRSLWNVGRNLNLDMNLRKVDGLENTEIEGYTTLDARFAWQVTKQLEVSLNGRNLFGAPFTESEREVFSPGTYNVRPYGYLKIDWQL